MHRHRGEDGDGECGRDRAGKAEDPEEDEPAAAGVVLLFQVSGQVAEHPRSDRNDMRGVRNRTDGRGRDGHAPAAAAPPRRHRYGGVQLDHGGQTDQDPGPAPAITAQGQHRGHEQKQGQPVHVSVAGQLNHRERGQCVPGHLPRVASLTAERDGYEDDRDVVDRAGRELPRPGPARSQNVSTWTTTNQASATGG